MMLSRSLNTDTFLSEIRFCNAGKLTPSGIRILH